MAISNPDEGMLKVQRTPRTLAPLVLSFSCVFALACNSDDTGSGMPTTPAAAQTHKVPCTDQSIGELMLFDKPSPDGVLNETEDHGVFETTVDSSAGGMQVTRGFVYAHFTDTGLKTLLLSDEDAFSSVDWQIAFRRYVLRLNSGVSGPGSVTGARTKPDTQFDTLTAPPSASEVPYREERYFTDTCEFVNDGSGIGAPGTALASYWKYEQCVQMTGNVFVLALGGSHHVKLQVLSYYTEANQRVCDETGSVPQPSGAGNFKLRWAFLD